MRQELIQKQSAPTLPDEEWDDLARKIQELDDLIAAVSQQYA